MNHESIQARLNLANAFSENCMHLDEEDFRQVFELVKSLYEIVKNKGKKIKDCPFCGSECEIEIDTSDKLVRYRVKCINTPSHALDRWILLREGAINLWNERKSQK